MLTFKPWLRSFFCWLRRHPLYEGECLIGCELRRRRKARERAYREAQRVLTRLQ